MITVPVRNEDGSIKFEYTLSAEQARSLLEFAFNFLIVAGMANAAGISVAVSDLPPKEQLN